ncbi:MAG: L-seryl-tRNA(Sec) selenium transferase [Deltaproteobacteria bacterium HGW-Deltaproteobacteria-14]|jgi:L-seryl-tRNA(Ser) seleniumtransferase|nr:MAG: L-seryl-tRNA(Sec) selenium transferase [Deltaproteobacteria bacterium HGW-Deltaproteobacteria-14]
MIDPSRLRALPKVDHLAAAPALAASDAPASLRVEAARHAIARAREALLAGGPPPAAGALEESALAWLARAVRPSLEPVLNATGVIVHTNLGRAPLGAGAVAAALGACNLEYDLGRGERGSRRDHVESLLTALSGAEAALVVNNNAAAVMLILGALCAGREVIISRGELVEIGGSFRVPDILAASGATLREVGTTNRTWPDDYRAAGGERTAAILRVHPSNYAVHGFVHRPEPEELGAVARELGILYIDDLGSGTFGPLPAPLGGSDRVQRALRAGADVVCFSGDKILGGPQAGIVLGRREIVDRLARHPLMRALRPDKLALAALEHTLIAYRKGELHSIPVARMLHVPMRALQHRARALAAELRDAPAAIAVAPCDDAVGGGSYPGEALPGAALTVRPRGVEAGRLAAELRSGAPPIIPVVADGAVWLHLRTIPPEEDDALVAGLRRALDAITVDTAGGAR